MMSKEVKRLHVETEKIISDCIKRWNSDNELDDSLEFFKDQFSIWFSKIPEDTQSVVCRLLEIFDYYSHKRANMHLSQLHQKLTQSYPFLNNDNTIFTFIKSGNSESKSSNDYWSEYKRINQISHYICCIDIKDLDENQLSKIGNIVLIDDCCASGNSLINFIKSNIDLFTNKSIFVVTIHVMENAITKLEDFANKNNFKINFIYITKRMKAFTHKIFKYDKHIAKILFRNVSKLLEIPDNEIFGRYSSESLMAFYNNTPNNTLGVFRYKTNTNNPLFPRRQEVKPTWWSMKKRNKIQKISNYNKEIGNRND